MRRKVWLAVLLALVFAAPADAAVTCAYTAGNARVTVTFAAALESAEISRSGSKIIVGGSGLVEGQCGTATVKNTNAIYVVAPGAFQQQTLTIELAGGPFAPGKTKESSGLSEIEFNVDLGTSTDAVRIYGSSKADDLRLGTAGLNMNADGDLDLTPANVEEWTILGGGGNDRISAAGKRGTGGIFGRNLVLYGELGDDTVTGGSGSDTVGGDAGNDSILGGGGPDVVYGGTGNDSLAGGDGTDTLYPQGGNDRADGGNGVDYIYTEATRDGKDDYRGGAGNDTVYWYMRTAPLKLSFDGKANDGLPNERDNIRNDIEMIYGGAGNDTITGSARVDLLEGGLGADVISGGAGDDFISGGSDASGDTLKGGDGQDSITAGDGGDNIDGGAGEDSLYGGLGNDTVQGGSGNDYVYEDLATNGADVLNGGTGVDQIEYRERSTGVGIRFDGLANDGQGAEGDNLIGFENASGSSAGDVFLGDGSNNVFQGWAGIDLMDGAGGSDQLYGGLGTDTLSGGDGTHFLFGNEDADTLNAVDGGYDQLDGGPAGDACNSDAIDLKTNCP